MGVVGFSQAAADGGTYWSPMDLRLIEEIRSTPNILRLLVSSLCPAIFGQEMVKAGLVLSMLSGVSRGGGINGTRALGERGEGVLWLCAHGTVSGGVPALAQPGMSCAAGDQHRRRRRDVLTSGGMMP
eukprot:SAG25_NODE_481_length_7507_cov_80.752160_9_plen_128_part_00